MYSKITDFSPSTLKAMSYWILNKLFSCWKRSVVLIKSLYLSVDMKFRFAVLRVTLLRGITKTLCSSVFRCRIRGYRNGSPPPPLLSRDLSKIWARRRREKNRVFGPLKCRFLRGEWSFRGPKSGPEGGSPPLVFG